MAHPLVNVFGFLIFVVVCVMAVWTVITGIRWLIDYVINRSPPESRDDEGEEGTWVWMSGPRLDSQPGAPEWYGSGWRDPNEFIRVWVPEEEENGQTSS